MILRSDSYYVMCENQRKQTPYLLKRNIVKYLWVKGIHLGFAKILIKDHERQGNTEQPLQTEEN